MVTASYLATHFPDVVATLVLAVIALVVWRGGGGSALQVLRSANEVLAKRVDELERQAKEDARTIAKLTARTDITEALGPLTAWTKQHELRAQERANAQILALEHIVAALNVNSSTT